MSFLTISLYVPYLVVRCSGVLPHMAVELSGPRGGYAVDARAIDVARRVSIAGVCDRMTPGSSARLSSRSTRPGRLHRSAQVIHEGRVLRVLFYVSYVCKSSCSGVWRAAIE